MKRFVISTILVLAVSVQVLATLNMQSSQSSSYTSLSTALEKRSSGDNLDVPEWLQDIPEESKVAKYRKRRFLNFPTGSTLLLEVTFALPVPDLSVTTNIELYLSMKFNLPNETDISTGRSFSQREDFYLQAEKFLDRFGYDGHACTLRTICEVAEMPFDHGIFGEILNLLLTSAMGSNNIEDDNDLTDDYSSAQYYGRNHGSCHSLYPECPLSFTNILSNIVPQIQ